MLKPINIIFKFLTRTVTTKMYFSYEIVYNQMNNQVKLPTIFLKTIAAHDSQYRNRISYHKSQLRFCEQFLISHTSVYLVSHILFLSWY